MTTLVYIKGKSLCPLSGRTARWVHDPSGPRFFLTCCSALPSMQPSTLRSAMAASEVRDGGFSHVHIPVDRMEEGEEKSKTCSLGCFMWMLYISLI